MNPERAASWLARLTGAFLLLQIAVTWPLWSPTPRGPQIPWFEFLCRAPLWVDATGLALMGVGSAGMLLLPGRPLRKIFPALTFAGLGVLILLDQHRLQPWAWQYLILSALLWLGSSRMACRCAVWVTVGLYFYSAISKLDVAFLNDQGQMLLEGLVRPLPGLNVDVGRWPLPVRRWLAAGFPMGELTVAILLGFRATRRWGLMASLAMHLTLLWTLGVGLRHSHGVLLWNLFFLAQNVVLFSRGPETSSTGRQERETFFSRIAPMVLTAAVMLAPALEFWNRFDHWPGWAVYSSRPAQVGVYLDEGSASSLDAAVAPYVRPPGPLERWSRLQLEDWSFRTRRCPIYPQARYRLALALAMTKNLPDNAVFVEVNGTPDRLTGLRESRSLSGRVAIEEELQSAFFNTRPRSIEADQD